MAIIPLGTRVNPSDFFFDSADRFNGVQALQDIEQQRSLQILLNQRVREATELDLNSRLARSRGQDPAAFVAANAPTIGGQLTGFNSVAARELSIQRLLANQRNLNQNAAVANRVGLNGTSASSVLGNFNGVFTNGGRGLSGGNAVPGASLGFGTGVNLGFGTAAATQEVLGAFGAGGRTAFDQPPVAFNTPSATQAILDSLRTGVSGGRTQRNSATNFTGTPSVTNVGDQRSRPASSIFRGASGFRG